MCWAGYKIGARLVVRCGLCTTGQKPWCGPRCHGPEAMFGRRGAGMAVRVFFDLLRHQAKESAKRVIEKRQKPPTMLADIELVIRTLSFISLFFFLVKQSLILLSWVQSVSSRCFLFSFLCLVCWVCLFSIVRRISSVGHDSDTTTNCTFPTSEIVLLEFVFYFCFGYLCSRDMFPSSHVACFLPVSCCSCG